jgi:iron-sulfur cluster repair protein YtfE (RIC family)
MNLPTEILPDHHKHCDDLFATAEGAVQDGDWAAAEKSFARFRAQMLAHFQAEEQLLFPAFEAATGMSQGPTQMMRHEHEQMRSLLSQLGEACASHDDDGYGGAAETLLMLMQQHNMKEENILYPMCDRSLGSEAERIGAELRALLVDKDA